MEELDDNGQAEMLRLYRSLTLGGLKAVAELLGIGGTPPRVFGAFDPVKQRHFLLVDQ